MAVEVGSIVEGKVTGVKKFGAFVLLPDGKTGMVHISEVAPVFVKEIRDFVTEGQAVKVKVIGINDDGKSVVSGYTGFEGKDCQTVVSELVREIYEDGYFENTVAGRAKNVVVKLEEGSD